MTAVAVAAINCLLQLILVSGTTVASAGRRYEKQLQVLGEVVSGPARGRPLALHLDAALPAEMLWAVLGVEAVRRTPHFTQMLSLNHNRGLELQKETAMAAIPRSSSSSMLHVVVWLTPRPKLLQALWLHWKPRNLLLFSLGSSPDPNVLLDDSLSGVVSLALIGNLSAEADISPDTLGVYTVLPFSPISVQLLGPWGRGYFSSWEALFPDRFPSFEGYTFEIVPYINYPPYIYRPFVEESEFASQKYGRGVAIETFELISIKLNYTYTITEMVGKWGAIENGTWVGSLGTMARKEKNFTINGYFINEDRISGFDPSATVGSESSCVFVPSPKPLPEWLSIIRPFSPSVWVSFVVVVAIAVLSMASLVSLLRSSVIDFSHSYQIILIFVANA